MAIGLRLILSWHGGTIEKWLNPYSTKLWQDQNHNRPEAYLLPAAYYERLMAYLEDLEDAKLVRERANGPFVEVSLDEL